MAKILNLKLDCTEGHKHASLSWDDGAARFHIWVRFPDLTPVDDVLYKNPMHGIGFRDDGYFNTRRLDRKSKAWRPVIERLLALAIRTDMVEEVRQRHITAAGARRLEESAAARRLRLRDAAPDMHALLIDLERSLGMMGFRVDHIQALLARIDGGDKLVESRYGAVREALVVGGHLPASYSEGEGAP